MHVLRALLLSAVLVSVATCYPTTVKKREHKSVNVKLVKVQMARTQEKIARGKANRRLREGLHTRQDSDQSGLGGLLGDVTGIVGGVLGDVGGVLGDILGGGDQDSTGQPTSISHSPHHGHHTHPNSTLSPSTSFSAPSSPTAFSTSYSSSFSFSATYTLTSASDYTSTSASASTSTLASTSTTTFTTAALSSSLPSVHSHHVHSSTPHSTHKPSTTTHASTPHATPQTGSSSVQTSSTSTTSSSPSPSQSSGGSRINHNVALADANNEIWHGAISVGNPPQQFTVDVDTGSGDFFLPSVTCDSTCDGHKRYNASASTTAEDAHTTFLLGYQDGSSVMGEQYDDTVQLAGLTATGQRLGAASRYSTTFNPKQFPPDGLIGFGFPGISSYGKNPLFWTLLDQNQISIPIFSLYITKSGSQLTLGGTDSSKYTGSFTYTPVTKVGFWQITADTIAINGQEVFSSVPAIIDSGTTFIIGNKDDVQKLYDQIPGSKDASDTIGEGYYTYPCDSDPSLAFTVGGKQFTLSSQYLNFGEYQNTGQCMGGISWSTDLDWWIIGDIFLRNVYTTFDAGNKRVGFADLA